ncbi:hypothetical protein ACF082_23280 [Streptomyces lydicus]|uniref:hypothetical protein n=1 Tax=Streptomyces lydicus TaxID=47763 RepID=UPI0037016195
MDEGNAALYAAIIGFAAALIGAAVGGWASWRAAKHSADAAVRATVEQVTGQAANELAQWIRQERRKVYGEVIAAYAQMGHALIRLSAAPTDDELEAAYQVEADKVRVAAHTVRLLGPDSVNAAAWVLIESTHEARNAIREWARQVARGSSGLREMEEAAEETQHAMGASYTAFLAACREVLLTSQDEGSA